MENLMIDATSRSPKIYFNGDKGILEIEGRSTPENADAFYGQLIDEIIEYKKKPVKELIAKIDLDHINTASAKMLYKLFKSIVGVKAKIIWIYEDDEMLEAGNDYDSMMENKLTFEFVKK
jgi:NAD-dependent DNA ligase